jgi:hypothetical protein
MSLLHDSSGGIMKVFLYNSNGSVKELELKDTFSYPPAILWDGSFYIRSAGEYYHSVPCYTVPLEES